jgi:RNA polymerase sigma-70 factor (ECF subfamily)
MRDSEGNDCAGNDATDVARARGGDTAALGLLLARYEHVVQAYIYGLIGGDRDDMLDLAQETFLRACRAIPRTRGALNVPAWLCRIGRNAYIDEMRRRQRYRLKRREIYDQSLRVSRDGHDPLWAVIDREEDATLQSTLRRLPPRQRRALVLHAYEGRSYEEIGAMLGVRRTTVKGIIFRARAEVRRLAGLDVADA